MFKTWLQKIVRTPKYEYMHVRANSRREKGKTVAVIVMMLVIDKLSQIKSEMIMQMPIKEQMALIRLALMLALTTQGLGSFADHTERDPETRKDIPPHTRYPEYQTILQLCQCSSVLITEKTWTRPMSIWTAPSVLVSSSMNFLESNVEKDGIDRFSWFEVYPEGFGGCPGRGWGFPGSCVC